MNQPDFTLEEIRPANIMETYRELRASDLLDILDSTTGELSPRYALKRSCPACAGSAATLSFRKEGFNFVTCDACELLYVNPVLSETALATWYATAESQKWFEQQALARSMDTRLRAIFEPRLEQIERWHPSRGRLLDIGCSRGFFMALASEKGWETYGVEIDPALARESAERSGGYTWSGRCEDVDIPETIFDVVTLWEVIEHVIEPSQLIAKLQRVLKPGGSLVLTTPNFDGIEFEAVGRLHDNIEAPAHINYFSPATLTPLLERSGFVDIRITTPGRLDLDNVLDAIAQLPERGIGDRFLTRLAKSPGFEVVRDSVVRLIQQAGLSGNMHAVAVRR